MAVAVEEILLMPLPLHRLTSPPLLTVNDSQEEKNSLSQSGGRVNLEGKGERIH